MYLPTRERISVLRRPTSLRRGESVGEGGFRTYVMSSSPTTAHMSFLSGIELGTVNNSNFWCTPENSTTLVCCGRRSTGCAHFGLESKRQRMTISSERPPPLMYWHPCTTKEVFAVDQRNNTRARDSNMFVASFQVFISYQRDASHLNDEISFPRMEVRALACGNL